MHTLSVIGNAAKTMTSREIAELVESRHDDVKRSISRLAEKGVFAIPPMAGYLDSLGRTGQTEYLLDKRSSLIVVAQLCPEFTAKLVDRWQELEARAAQPIALSRMDILTMAIDSERRAVAAEAQLTLAAPKAAFVDAYVDSTGLKGFRQVAKLLKIKEPMLRAFLKAESIMYLLGGEWCAYQNHIEAGRFKVKTGASEVSGHAFNRSLFTPKGVEWLAGLWAVHCLNSRSV